MQREAEEPQQAAVIAFQRDANGIRFCVTRKRKSGAWGIPKGFVDPGQTLPEAALNEAEEEVGLRGRLVGEPIGTYSYDKWGNTFSVAVYLMDVTDQDDHWEEESVRERHWLTPEAAKETLREHPGYRLLERAIELLDAAAPG
jgi:phosphohistidine phosphatase